MFIQFDDNIFRRNFEMKIENDTLYDREGDLKALATNKANVPKRLKSWFAGKAAYEHDGKMGKMNLVNIQPESRLRSEFLVKKGQEVSDPCPNECRIFDLIVSVNELVNRDARSRALTYFLNDCAGAGSYKGVDAQKSIDTLIQNGIITVEYLDQKTKLHLRRIEFWE